LELASPRYALMPKENISVGGIYSSLYVWYITLSLVLFLTCWYVTPSSHLLLMFRNLEYFSCYQLLSFVDGHLFNFYKCIPGRSVYPISSLHACRYSW
jgi:hypothetical protein